MVRVSWTEDASMRTSLETEGHKALSDPWLSNPAKMRKEGCYGQRRTWGQYSSLSPSPAHLSHTRNITLSRIKVWEIYFYKEVCSFIHWSSYIIGWLFPHIFVYLYLQLYYGYTTLHWVRVGLGVIAIKRYPALFGDPELAPHHQIPFSVIVPLLPKFNFWYQKEEISFF